MPTRHFLYPQVKYHEAHNAAFERVLEPIRHKTITSTISTPYSCATCHFKAFCEVQRIRHLPSVKEMLAAVDDKTVTVEGAPCDCRFFRSNPVVIQIRLMLKKELERVPEFLR